VPTIFREGRLRFFFYSNEGTEPRHVHVQVDANVAKLWLEPVSVADAGGLSARDLAEAQRIARRRQGECIAAWDAFFGR
jgi:hypothetical protein